MVTIKSYTDIEQSKKLAEILPLDSADMAYLYWINSGTKQEGIDAQPTIMDCLPIESCDIPSWSLAALLSVLPEGTNISTRDPLNKIRYSCWNDYDITYASNSIDAAFEMICRLKEKNLL